MTELVPLDVLQSYNSSFSVSQSLVVSWCCSQPQPSPHKQWLSVCCGSSGLPAVCSCPHRFLLELSGGLEGQQGSWNDDTQGRLDKSLPTVPVVFISAKNVVCYCGCVMSMQEEHSVFQYSAWYECLCMLLCYYARIILTLEIPHMWSFCLFWDLCGLYCGCLMRTGYETRESTTHTASYTSQGELSMRLRFHVHVGLRTHALLYTQQKI